MKMKKTMKLKRKRKRKRTLDDDFSVKMFGLIIDERKYKNAGFECFLTSEEILNLFVKNIVIKLFKLVLLQ